MRSDFAQRWGAPATTQQLNALIQQAVEEELLYREARLRALDFQDRSVQRRLAEKMRVVGGRPARNPGELAEQARELGLDDDVVIRRLLIEKMRLVLAQEADHEPLTEHDLADYLERHRDQFEQLAEVTFSHVFLSRSSRGASLEKDARAMLRQLRSQSTGPEASVELSDPFPIELQMRAYSENRVMARFGKRFAKEVFGLEPGAWAGPIESPYGLHLVWLESKTPPRMPELAAVRRQVAEGVRAERAAQRIAQGLARLRTLYDVQIATS